MSGVTLTSLPAVVMPTRGEVWLEGTLQTPPSAARTFVAGDQVTAAVEVYAPQALGTAPDLFAEIETAAGAIVLRLSGSTRPRTASSPGTSQVAFPLDTGKLPAGEYVLRVVAPAAAHDPVERRVPFEIVTAGSQQ